MTNTDNTPDEVQQLADEMYYGALMGPTVSRAELRTLTRAAAAVGARTALEEVRRAHANMHNQHDYDLLSDALVNFMADEETKA